MAALMFIAQGPASWPPPEGFIDALAGAITGGVLAALGGFLGILYVQSRGKKEADAQYQAALLVVLDELAANEANIEHLLTVPFGPDEFYDTSYRSVELILARRLDPPDRQLLAQAYEVNRSRWRAEDPSESPINRIPLRQLGMIVPNHNVLKEALAHLKAARVALTRYVGSPGSSSRSAG